MGDNGYTVDEERIDNENDNNACNSSPAFSNRSNAISGYSKLIILLILFAFICCFRAYVLDRVIVSGESMSPSFSDGDVMWARKFDTKEFSRYQVVVAKVRGKFVIKRVIGLPNEILQIIDGLVYINDNKLTDDYGYSTTVYGLAEEKIILQNNEYFLIGDNRDNSLDCRIWGAINQEDIKGIVVFQFFPFWEMKTIK